jgi:trans-aconitate 2-methyltransferase
VGCGPGDISAMLATRLPDWQVVGVDASEPMLELAARHGQPNLRFRQADAKKLDTIGERFDAIVSNSLLHHLPEPGGLWSGIIKSANPGARLFLRDLRRPDSLETARDLVRRHAGTESALLGEEFFRSLLSAFTVDEVAAQLNAAGLSRCGVKAFDDRYLDVVGVI